MDFSAQLDQPLREPLTPGEKLWMALRLYDEGVAMQRLNFRRRNPAASEAEIDEKMGSWLERESPDGSR